MSFALKHSPKRKKKNGSIDEVGFNLPSMPAMPADPGYGEILPLEAQLALGYRIAHSQIGMLNAMCVHSDVVSLLVEEVQAVLDGGQPVGQAVALIKVFDKWIRAESIPDKEFKAIAQHKLNAIRSVLMEVQAQRDGTSDLFTLHLRLEMASKMAEILPYDLILFKAANLFRARCTELDGARRDLIKLLSTELKLPRPKLKAMVGEAWISPGLFATLNTSVYELSLYPPKAKRSLRDSVIAAQRNIKGMVVSGSSNPGDMIAAWSEFCAHERELSKSVTLMYQRNQGLVDTFVGQYRHVGDEDQLRSAGEEGLLRAIYRFAPEMGFRFSTLAVKWVGQTIVRELQKLDLIRLPEGSQSKLFAIRTVLEEQPNASNQVIAEITGLSVDDVQNLMFFINGNTGLSIDNAFQADGSNESEGMHEIIADSSDFTADFEVENSNSFIDQMLSVLPARHEEVVRHVFGIGRPETTLKDMGVMLGMSIERVRQLRIEAMDMLKESEHFEDLLELWS